MGMGMELLTLVRTGMEGVIMTEDQSFKDRLKKACGDRRSLFMSIH